MTTNPLILYYDGPDTALAIDARAGAQLLLERWPGAEVHEVAPGGTVNIAWLVEDRPMWVLGLGGDHLPPDDEIIAIDPTPDASIVMQVWAILDFCAGSPCQHYPVACQLCEHRGDYTCAERDKDAAPWHVRYIDDAVCERWKLLGARAVWAWMESWSPRELFFTIGAGSVQQWSQRQREIIEIGREILRAQKRWEEEQQRAQLAKIDERLDGIDALTDEVARLSTERDEARTEVGRLQAGFALASKLYADLANTGRVLKSEHDALSELTGVGHA